MAHGRMERAKVEERTMGGGSQAVKVEEESEGVRQAEEEERVIARKELIK